MENEATDVTVHAKKTIYETYETNKTEKDMESSHHVLKIIRPP